MFVDGVEQRHRLQPVATGTRTDLFDHSTLVDRLLHAGDDQPHAARLDELVAVLDHLGEVVPGVDMHDGEGQPGGGEGEQGKVQQDRGVLATTEQQHRVLTLGRDLADDRDGLIGQLLEVQRRGALCCCGI